MTADTPRDRAADALCRAAEFGSQTVTVSVDDLRAILAEDGRPAPAPRQHPFPGNVLVHVENMSEGDSDEDGPTQARAETCTVTENLDAAMVLTSDTGRMSLPRYRHVDGALSRFEVEPLHRPVLDLDMPCTLLSSSTPGHHHLLIDSPMPWSTYLDLLRALVAAGLVESGYVGAAEERGHTGVRVPWFRKGDVPPNVDGTVPSVPFDGTAIEDVDVDPFGVAS